MFVVVLFITSEHPHFLFVSVVKYYGGCSDFCSCCEEYYASKNFDEIINVAIEEYKKGEFLNDYNDNKD